jgi:hypothetical protein
MGRNSSMKITSVTGHMMGLEFDARYKSWQGVNPEQLFTAEVGVSKTPIQLSSVVNYYPALHGRR